MNRVETVLMNNPVRAFFQRYVEAEILRKMGGSVDGKKVLEIGCGCGVGIEILRKKFGAGEIHAVDLDETMIENAQKRITRKKIENVKVFTGDATKLDVPDISYDAVFDFAIIHHIPDWKSSLKEVNRILRPGGLFFFEEVTRHALQRWSYRTFMEHPPEPCWFSPKEFINELESLGIHVGKTYTEKFFGDFVFGVGRKNKPKLH